MAAGSWKGCSAYLPFPRSAMIAAAVSSIERRETSIIGQP
jgi:hypothetical protein